MGTRPGTASAAACCTASTWAITLQGGSGDHDRAAACASVPPLADHDALVIRPTERSPLTETIEDRWLKLQPIKIGWLGMEWQRFEREIRMAFDEGIERGVLDRRYEFLFEDDAGLPQGTAAGWHRLVPPAGATPARPAVVGANYTDSALRRRASPRRPPGAAAQHAVPIAFHGEYCFRLGNGDVGGDPALMVNWLKRNGLAGARRSSRRGRRSGRSTSGSSARSAAVSASRSLRGWSRSPSRDHHRGAGRRGSPTLRDANAGRARMLGYGGSASCPAAAARRWRSSRLGSAAHHDDRVSCSTSGASSSSRAGSASTSGARRTRACTASTSASSPASARIRGCGRTRIPGLAYDMAATMVECAAPGDRADRAGRRGGPGADPLHARSHRRPQHPHRRRTVRPPDVHGETGCTSARGRATGKLEFAGLFETTDDY